MCLIALKLSLPYATRCVSATHRNVSVCALLCKRVSIAGYLTPTRSVFAFE